MKKILVTTLALSLAVVSTVDARRIGAPRVETVEKAIKGEATDLKNNPDKERAMALLDKLSKNPNMMDVSELELQREDLIEKIQKEAGILKETKTGWIFNTQEYSDQKKIVADLKNDLRKVNQDIASKKKDLPKDSNTAIYATLVATAVLGTAAALEYWYGGKEASYTGRGIAAVGTGLGTARTRLGEAGTYVKEGYQRRAPVMLGGTPAPAPAE